jgi:hypothetical protein
LNGRVTLTRSLKCQTRRDQNFRFPVTVRTSGHTEVDQRCSILFCKSLPSLFLYLFSYRIQRKPFNVITANVIVRLMWSNWSNLKKAQVTVYKLCCIGRRLLIVIIQ